MDYEPTIGLEIHIELNTKSKMFCACLNDSSETQANKNICPVCSGQPGSLPVVNKEAVEKAIRTALALNCQIAEETFFERKNYFYPDLPKGYQISQYQAPLSKNGYLDIRLPEGDDKNFQFSIFNFQTKRIRIERIHLEEDAGKLVHPEGADYSLVDLNRAGMPLMELVTEPDIQSAQEAAKFVEELQLILRYLGVSGANMEKGEMRAEVNISLIGTNETTNHTNNISDISDHIRANSREINSRKLGTKVEVKNLNSIRAVRKSIEYEIKRQSEILEKGEKVVQETRGWDEKKQSTFSQRSKESSHDYRYFPEPDLLPLKIEEEFIAKIKAEIPELPEQKRQRLAKEYHLTEKESELFVSQRDLGNYFEKVVSELTNWVSAKFESGLAPDEFQKLIKLACNYIITDLQFLLKEKGIEYFSESKFRITAENFAEFLSMIYLQEISSKIAKLVLSEMFHQGGDPSQIIIDKGWQMVSDTSEIEKAIQEVIANNTKAIDDFKKGRAASLQFLIGQVMAKTKGKANPQKVQEILNNLMR